MWWFLVITLGSSIVPAYVAPMGPFPSQKVCEEVRRAMQTVIEYKGRYIEATGCWENK